MGAGVGGWLHGSDCAPALGHRKQPTRQAARTSGHHNVAGDGGAIGAGVGGLSVGSTLWPSPRRSVHGERADAGGRARGVAGRKAADGPCGEIAGEGMQPAGRDGQATKRRWRAGSRRQGVEPHDRSRVAAAGAATSQSSLRARPALSRRCSSRRACGDGLFLCVSLRRHPMGRASQLVDDNGSLSGLVGFCRCSSSSAMARQREAK